MKEKWKGWFIFWGAFLAYGLTTSEVLTIAHDSAGYISNIMGNINEWFHPFHLIYNPIARFFIECTDFIGVKLEPHQTVGLLNAFLGAISASVLYSIFKNRLKLQSDACFWGTLLCTASYSMWYYSGAVEVFALSTLSSLLVLDRLFKEEKNWIDHTILSLLFTIAILSHVTSVFFIFPIVWVYRNRKTALIMILCGTAIFVGLSYIIVLSEFLQIQTFSEGWTWLRGISDKGQYWHRPWISTTWIKVVVGFGRAIIGGHFILSIEDVYQFVKSIFSDKWLMDEQFLVRNMGLELSIWLTIVSVTFFGMVISMLVKFRYYVCNSIKRNSEFWIVIGLWVIPLSLLFVIWEPHNSEYWIPSTIALWMGVTIVFSRAQKPQIIKGIVIMLFLINFFGSIIWTQNRENDYYYYQINPVLEAEENAIVLAGRSWQYKEYLRYYRSDITFLAWDNGSIKEQIKRIEKKSKSSNPIYVLGNAIQLEEKVRKLNPKLEKEVSFLWDKLSNRLEIMSHKPVVFKLK